MLRFCNKNKGAISVFLTLILLPVLLLGGLTTDAARIYASKVVISDAGELAMNAALAQYDEKLLDEYGLFVMSKDPESMEESLQKYFNESLNGTGIASAEDYDKILDLVTKEFSVINLEASKIYKTDVEKQQIIEYMKYRAPVCLTELLLKKLDVLKETKQITKAMEAQMTFAEDMADCQDAMEAAKTALDNLNIYLNNYPNQSTIQTVLDETEKVYKSDLSTVLLMAAAAKKYNQTVDIDGIVAAESYVREAEGIDLGNPLSGSSFEAYIQTKYYSESAKKLKNIVDTKKSQEPSDEKSEEYAAWKAEVEQLEELQTNYNSAVSKAGRYISTLQSYALQNCIKPQTSILNGYYQKTLQGIELTTKALDKLEIVERKFKKAAESWETWSSETEKISDSENLKDEKTGMQNSVKEYEGFFATADGAVNQDNLNNLGILMENIKTDNLYFAEMRDILTEVKFFNKPIATVSADNQYTAYWSQAQSSIQSVVTKYDEITPLRNSYSSNYVSTQISTAYAMRRIHDDPFYLEIVKYCENQVTEESEAQKNAANEKLEQGKKANDEAQSEDGYPQYTWTLDETMPSVLLAKEAEDADNTASIDGNVGKSGRKKAIAAAKNSISEASNFLTKLDSILTEGVSNLYVAEYAMQMFSYYTVDKRINKDEKVETIPEDEVTSLSGYKMSGRDAYKAEVEYILWGNAKSQTNIRNTVMMIFGIRLLLNSIFSFTNSTLTGTARANATAIAGAAPYLIPIIQAIIQFGFSCIETANDIARIKEGYGVAVLKEAKTWKTYALYMNGFGDNTKGNLTLDYSEFLRIFLNINMLGGLEGNKLARIGDCIQLNTESDITKGYTMLALEASVKVRTTFMKKISDIGSGAWELPDNTYSVQYQSVLGY